MPQKSILHLKHSLFFCLVQFRTWNLSTLRNCYNQLLPFFYAFLVPYCNEFLRESWRNYICTIFFPRERLVRTREFCSCYYNFPLLYVLEWSKSRNISTELAKLPYTLSSFFVLFLCLDSTGSANSNWCISDEHFFMIQWRCIQNPMIFGILR